MTISAFITSDSCGKIVLRIISARTINGTLWHFSIPQYENLNEEVIAARRACFAEFE